ncbi:MAG: hypothetical protein U1F66_10660 [bacterium]
MAPPSLNKIPLQTRNPSHLAPGVVPAQPPPSPPSEFSGSLAPRLRSDLSAWMPRLWRNPGGRRPDLGHAEDSATAWAEGVVTALEDTLHGVAVDLGIADEASGAPDPETEGIPTEESALDRFYLLEKLPEEERQAMWERLMERLHREGTPLPAAGCDSYEAFRESLAALGPRLPSRVASLRNAMALLHNHETLGHEPVDLPIALAILAGDDHNGAMGVAGFPMLDTLAASGRFHVLYVEADDEDDVLRSMEEIHALTGRRVHTLVMGGHGTPNTLALGGEDLGRAAPGATYEEADYVDTSDFYLGEFAGLNDLLAENGQVLLWSCSTGSGGEEVPYNLANSFSRAVPGRRVYSMREPGNIRSLEVAEDGSLEVEWNNDAPYVAFSADGAAPAPMPAASGQNSNMG